MEKTLLYVVYNERLDGEQFSSLSEKFSSESVQVVETDYPKLHRYFDRHANMGALPYPNVVCLDLQGFEDDYAKDAIQDISRRHAAAIAINGSDSQIQHARERGIYCASDNNDLFRPLENILGPK